MSSENGKTAGPTKPINRLILLGASNLTLSIYQVIRLIQARCGGPSDVLVAAGHGRSYGKYSRVLVRGLPGITASGLWQRLKELEPLPTYVFITDVGNDIPYGHTPDELLQWIGFCVDQLQVQQSKIVMTNIPIESVTAMSEFRFKIIRAVLFPFCQISREQVIERAKTVHKQLAVMAEMKGFTLCEQDSNWFGPDNIHILYWKRLNAYKYIFDHFPSSKCDEPFSSRIGWGFSAWTRRPEFHMKNLLGHQIHRKQPSGQLNDGTIVSMY